MTVKKAEPGDQFAMELMEEGGTVQVLQSEVRTNTVLLRFIDADGETEFETIIANADTSGLIDLLAPFAGAPYRAVLDFGATT